MLTVGMSQASGVHSRPIYHLDWCKQTGMVATASGDDAIRIFELVIHQTNGV